MENRREFIIDFAKNLCSFCTPLGGEAEIAKYIAGKFDSLGIEAELQPVVDGRPNVVAIIRGDPSYKSVLMNGHLDHPMPFGKWRRDPYKPWVEDGRLYGAGITDMRSGNISIMSSMAQLKESLPEKHGDVIAAYVMHHDTIGLGMKYFLDSCTWKIDAGICAEPTDSKLQLTHSGAWDWKIELEGVTRHQCMMEEAVNANLGMLKICEAISPSALTYTPDPRRPYLPRINIGIVNGGEDCSMAAEKCVIMGDIRFIEGMTVDGMKSDLQKIIDRVCTEMPGLKARLSTVAFQWPYKLEKTDPVSVTFQEAYREIAGREIKMTKGLPSGAFITDGADMVRVGIPTVFYGPGFWRTEPDESVAIDDLELGADVFELFCKKVVTQKR